MEKKKGMNTCVKAMLFLLVLVIGFIGFIFLDDGEVEGETVVGAGGLLAGEDLYFQYDTNKIPMQVFTEKMPDWKQRPWKDIYVPEIQAEEVDGYIEDTGKTGIPLGIFFYHTDSDYQRFDVKRFWSKTAKLFEKETGKQMTFRRVEINMVNKKHATPELKALYDKFMEHNIYPTGIQASIYFFAGGKWENQLRLPLRGSAVELIEDLDWLTEPRSSRILEHDEAMEKFNTTGGITQEGLDNIMTDKLTADYHIFNFPKENEYKRVGNRVVFSGGSERMNNLYDFIQFQFMEYYMYHTHNLEHAAILETKDVNGNDVQVQHGDMVYWRIVDKTATLIPRDLRTAEEIITFLNDHTLPPAPGIIDEKRLTGSAVYSLHLLKDASPTSVFIKIVYGATDKEKAKAFRIAKKIQTYFVKKGEDIVFPYFQMQPKSAYSLNAQINKLDEMKEFSNFVIIECKLANPKTDLVKEELTSVYGIEAIEAKIEKIKAYMEKMGDEIHDEL
ncbi:hypothetical protein HOP50_19g84050 [Chloropicon primus]|uniref:Uncharacterized protein n=1 Tax=Chloropicon primus TaxID=1764295 RepID=A0A5B8MZ65_9CHLO|nr:hypothetical protein A3770_19p83810 [Chloropicon primus]UPR05058.1 hypothetical protein HOP50_19g84050 [Chloropicon primus]|eukprot:QDZ25863.1 hypothetical protein A3770_19p83810 [Chloropicon primus]